MSATVPPSSSRTASLSAAELASLADDIKAWGDELGFQQVGITDTQLEDHEAHLNDWLDKGYHGEMGFMTKHGTKRTRPAELEPGTIRVISVRMDYLPADMESVAVLNQPERAYVSRYALGRDYHKLMRKRLAALAKRIEAQVGSFGYRAFVDSAPVMERALAQKAGLGWFGKNAMMLNPQAGSLFFLGELYTDLPLPVDAPFARDHCGSCNACQTVCPTGAIVADKVVDARKCISYLTIELHGAIPEQYRRAMGNRIYGCDDCQLFCPFTRFTQTTREADFCPAPRPRPRRAVNAVWLGRRRISRQDRRQRDSPHRLRALAAQHRRGAGQRALQPRRGSRADGAAQLPQRPGSRARRLGAYRAAPSP